MKIKSNIHAHTKYCNHSDIEPEWLVQEAIRLGFKQFTISEHIPYEKEIKGRTSWNEWEKIMEHFILLKNKYSNKDFELFIAVETEYLKEKHDFYLNFYKKWPLDFIIFGNHNVGFAANELDFFHIKNKEERIKVYVDQAIDGFKSGLFFHFAHPDLIVHFINNWNPFIEKECMRMIESAIEHDITLGLNVNGLYNNLKRGNPKEYFYPYDNFWKLVSKTNAKVRIEIDVHRTVMPIIEYVNKVYDLAIGWDIEKNLVDLITKEEIARVNEIKK